MMRQHGEKKEVRQKKNGEHMSRGIRSPSYVYIGIVNAEDEYITNISSVYVYKLFIFEIVLSAHTNPCLV